MIVKIKLTKINLNELVYLNLRLLSNRDTFETAQTEREILSLLTGQMKAARAQRCSVDKLGPGAPQGVPSNCFRCECRRLMKSHNNRAVIVPVLLFHADNASRLRPNLQSTHPAARVSVTVVITVMTVTTTERKASSIVRRDKAQRRLLSASDPPRRV